MNSICAVITNKLMALFLVCLFILSACASMNQAECVNADWRTIGFEDGTVGAHPNRIGSHRKACIEYGISPDLDAYNDGHSQGVELYCRPHSGFQAGLRGHSYNGVCPAELENEFLVAYQTGRAIYAAEKEIQRLDKLIRKDIADLNTLNDEIKLHESELINNKTTRKQRIELLSTLKALSTRQHDLAIHIRDLELDKANLQEQLDNYKVSAAYL